MSANDVVDLHGESLSWPEIERRFGIHGSELTDDDRFKKAMNLIEGPEYLDIGSDIGLACRFQSINHHDWHITGVDILPIPVQVAKKFRSAENITYRVSDFQKNKFYANQFDCVSALEVIEHISNPGQFITEVSRILKPSGCVVISTPNAVSLQNILRHVGQNIKNRVLQISGEKTNTGTNFDHVSSFDVFTLTRLLDRCGLEYVCHEYAGMTLPISRSKWVAVPFLSALVPFLSNTIIIKARKV